MPASVIGDVDHDDEEGLRQIDQGRTEFDDSMIDDEEYRTLGSYYPEAGGVNTTATGRQQRPLSGAASVEVPPRTPGSTSFGTHALRAFH